MLSLLPVAHSVINATLQCCRCDGLADRQKSEQNTTWWVSTCQRLVLDGECSPRQIDPISNRTLRIGSEWPRSGQKQRRRSYDFHGSCSPGRVTCIQQHCVMMNVKRSLCRQSRKVHPLPQTWRHLGCSRWAVVCYAVIAATCRIPNLPRRNNISRHKTTSNKACSISLDTGCFMPKKSLQLITSGLTEA
eukprot:4280791-Amphidinium_carterae.1